jgi:hypothetical protein
MKGTIDRSTAKLVPADGKEVFFWDDTLTGFGLRAHAARDGSIKRAYFMARRSPRSCGPTSPRV